MNSKEKTLQEKVQLGLHVTRKMIADFEDKLREAIKDENWSRAADLKAYIDGMLQIEVVFSNILD